MYEDLAVMKSRVLLPYVGDERFLRIVQEVLVKGLEELNRDEKKFSKNVIDPFAMLFESASFGLDAHEWIKNEKMRQAQKALSNKIGWFHQEVISSLDGWENLGQGGILDVVCHEQQIVAEIKNKFNTVKQSDLIGLYEKMAEMVQHKTQKYYNYTAYYVEIIPHKARRYDQCFVTSNSKTGGKSAADERIRQIDGASFYALATGFNDALAQLFYCLPEAMRIVMKRLHKPMRDIELTKVAPYFHQAYGAP